MWRDSGGETSAKTPDDAGMLKDVEGFIKPAYSGPPDDSQPPTPKPSEPDTEGSQLKRPVGIDVGKPQTNQTNALITGSQTASNDAHGQVPADPEEPGATQKPQDKEGLIIPEDAVSAEQVKLDDGEEAG